MLQGYLIWLRKRKRKVVHVVQHLFSKLEKKLYDKIKKNRNKQSIFYEYRKERKNENWMCCVNTIILKISIVMHIHRCFKNTRWNLSIHRNNLLISRYKASMFFIRCIECIIQYNNNIYYQPMNIIKRLVNPFLKLVQVEGNGI